MPEEEQAGEVENVRVIVRVRPMDKIELEAGSRTCVQVDKETKAIIVQKPNTGQSEPPKVYYFDNVFGENSSQRNERKIESRRNAINFAYSLRETRF